MSEFRVLGPVECHISGEPADLGPPKQRAVLAVLLVDAGQPVSSARLIDRVWGDKPPAQVHSVLYTYVSRIRRALGPGPRLLRRFGGYLLDVERSRVDVHQFRSLAQHSRAPGTDDDQRRVLLLQALGRWQGEPLAGIAGDWAGRVRDSLIRERLTVQLAYFDLELRHGRHREMIGELAELAAAHPTVEPLVGQLMLALHRSGRQREALDAFHLLRRRMVVELGVEPGLELHHLYRAMLTGEPAPTPAA
jgi:DNA-binding SARP family transcriptional activator